jgi:lysophospholipase L1-like esterase
MLARELPLTAWRFINVSRWGTTSRFWLTNDWIHRLVTTSHPDVVVLALGTNDAYDTPPAGIVDELIKLARQAGEGCPTGAGPPTLPATTCPRVIIATIPPLYEGGPFLTCQPTVERANDLLHEAWPPYLLADFDSWVTGPELYWPDGIHLTDEGQHRRAAEARNAIFRALAE